ncbi:class I adenylate-forming enzyme family protein [soil metagenome]
MNVAACILEVGAPDAVAVIDHGGAATTYRALRDEVHRVAAHLQAQGFEAGARAVLVAENNLLFIAAYLGTLRAGGVVVPVAPHITPEELSFIVASSGARVAVVQRKHWERVADALSGVHAIVDVAPDKVTKGATSFEALSALPAGRALEERVADGSELAALMVPSDSPGPPHGLMLPHTTTMANTRSIAEYLGLTPSDRMMAVLPLHYCYGASLLHTHLLVGGSLVIDNRFMFADKVLKRMNDTECTGFAGVPSHFQILLRTSSMKSMTFPRLRLIQRAGGKLAVPLLEELVATAAPARVFTMYGQTEATARLSYLPPDDLPTKLGSIGKGIPGVTLRICDEQGAPVPAGTVGEIVAEGGSIARGYWQDEAATSATFRNGRLHTGDLARADADGYITIVDRASDFLKCGGVRTSSHAIETVLFQVPEVVEAAVIAVPDDLLGDAPCVFIVIREGADAALVEASVRRECTTRLAPELMPKIFRFEKTLPKTASGKPSKLALRALLGSGS